MPWALGVPRDTQDKPSHVGGLQVAEGQGGPNLKEKGFGAFGMGVSGTRPSHTPRWAFPKSFRPCIGGTGPGPPGGRAPIVRTPVRTAGRPTPVGRVPVESGQAFLGGTWVTGGAKASRTRLGEATAGHHQKTRPGRGCLGGTHRARTENREKKAFPWRFAQGRPNTILGPKTRVRPKRPV